MDLLTDEDHYGPDDWYYYKVIPPRRRTVSPRVAGVGALLLLLALCYLAGVVLHAVCAP